jgi:hypothetical protein
MNLRDLEELRAMRDAGIDVSDFVGEPRPFVCPVCDVEIDLLDVIPHILDDHPASGVALAIRAEVRNGRGLAR